MSEASGKSVERNDYSRVSIVFLIGLIILFLLSIWAYLLPIKDSYGQTGTPPFMIAPASYTNPSFTSAFYYSTTDNVMMYDTLDISNLDSSRDITLELTGKIQGEEGWFAFSSTSVDVPAYTVFSPKPITFSIALPDGICEDRYIAYITATLTDYDGLPAGPESLLSTSVASEVIIDVINTFTCTGSETLPGLGAAPSFIPLPTILALIEEEPPPPPPSGGGGGGLMIIPLPLPIPVPEPPPVEEPPAEEPPGEVPPGEVPPGEVPPGEVPPGEEPPAEEPPLEEPVVEPIFLNLAAYPEKRVPPTNNWSTEGTLNLYAFGSTEPDYSLTVPTGDDGLGVVESTFEAGTYHVSFKGLSHLTRFLRNVPFPEGENVELDFTNAGTFYLLAGDVALSKDDYVNSFDLAATVRVMYKDDVHADLNADGTVNGLDLSIEAINIYKSGEKRVQE